jgi:folylpolyglutamate synthase/dihydropteroate synthase
VYEYIKPHIDKVKAEDIIINGKQIMHNKLQYSFREGSFIAELAKEKKVNKNTLAQISRAMID